MKSTVLDVIQQVPIVLDVSDAGDELVRMLADMDIDNDGIGGNPDHDPFHQDTTTLQRDGKSLDAYKEPFIVVPPIICRKTSGIVLGSLALVENIRNKRFCFAVVGDIGPTRKIGEGSPACARQLGIDPDARSGGTSEKIIRYIIFIGVPARINSVQYALQKY